MRQIHVDEDIRIRFPQRGTDFDDGVEVGILVLMMAKGDTVITRSVSPECFQQLKALAPQLSYRVTGELESDDNDIVRVTLTSSRLRPKLKVVS